MKKEIVIIIAGLMFLGVVGTSAKAAFFEFNRDLYFGLRGDADVEILQDFLTKEGVYGGPVNGNFFSLTQEGVKKFQAKNNITPAAGYFGPKTRKVVNEKANNIGTLPVTPSKEEINLQIQALLKKISELQALIALEEAPVTPAPTPTPTPPAPSLPNPFQSSLELTITYPSLTLGHYGDVTIHEFNVVNSNPNEKVAISRIKFKNEGTLVDQFIQNAVLQEGATGRFIASTNITEGIIEFKLTPDPTKIDQGLLVPGKYYSVIGTIATPNSSGYKPTIILTITSASDIDLIDPENTSRIGMLATTSFPVIGPRITTY